jgi:hypothetical protein
MTKLTEAQFSMQCAFIAKNAAAWAGDILTLPERCNEPADAKTVARFTSEMRGRLDRLDEWAVVSALTLKDDPCNIGRDGESERLREALEPFSRFAGPVFERNFNNDDPVDTITASDGEQVTLFARDFFAARAAIASYRKRTT